jgi:hypothetical protein
MSSLPSHLHAFNCTYSPLLAVGTHVFVKRLHSNSMLFTSIVDAVSKVLTNTPANNPTLLKKEMTYAS